MVVRMNTGAAAQRLLEIASTVETASEGRIYVELVNAAFLREGGNADDYRAGVERLNADGLIDVHPSGAFFTFTAKGAQRFA